MDNIEKYAKMEKFNNILMRNEENDDISSKRNCCGRADKKN